MTSTPLPEQGGFNERLDEILFAQYQLGRQHQRLSHGGTKRAMGGEITEAKAAVRSLIAEEIIGEDFDVPEKQLLHFARRAGITTYNKQLANAIKAEQRKRLEDTHGTK